jgi:4-hydroxy-3-methylbut-2-en-1-yl diphosphate reductase
VIVTIDPNAGFCFGVAQAIREAEHALDSGEQVFCLGDIVHNPAELDRLKAKGLEIIDHSRFMELKNATVLIRAHGEPPSTYKIAENNSLVIIDATCPIVQKLQQRIHKHYKAGIESEAQVVIFGKAGHAEVAGLTGQTDDNALIVSCMDDLQKIDFSKPVKVFAQTTTDPGNFNAIVAEIEQRMHLINPENEPEIFDTICRQVSGRAPLLKEFASSVDVLVFVSGRKSSNGAYLFGICSTANLKSYWVSDPGELKPEWFETTKLAGVTGATSTPLAQLQDVAIRIEGFTFNKTV